MKKNSFSIIIPVFNSEKFLELCIKSIINQEYDNFEAVFIDDGSIDNSLAILKRYSEIDKRIKFEHKINEGASAARNRGLDIAKNKYVLFVDSDDVLEANALNYFNEIINRNSDIDFFQASLLHFKNEIPNDYNESFGEKILSETERIAAINKLLIGDTRLTEFNVFPGPVCKIYKKEIIDSYHIRFNKEFFMYEDGIFNLEYLLKCKSMCISNRITYFYRENIDSITHGYNPNYFSQRISMIDYIRRIIDNNNLDIKFYYMFIYQSTIDILSFNVFSKNVKLSSAERKNLFITLRNNEKIRNSLDFKYIKKMELKKKVLIILFKHRQFLLLELIYLLFK
ncbi:MAG: glycosyltransferase family 2 protein [Bacilli bacterium]|nr:glycosyltransferase family 2 protein [Bacilli bacterium]